MKGRLISQVILFIFVTMCLAFSGCSNGSSNPMIATNYYTLSGAVNGTVAANVAITLSGASAANTTTASDGTYSFSGLAAGTYTVTPSLSGNSFNPSSTGIKISDTDVTFIDFTSSTGGLNFTVAGVVSGAVESGVGVELSVGGTVTGTTYTASNGTYSLIFTNGDNIVITPVLTGYTFTPANLAYNDVIANVTGANFVN